MGKRLCIKSLNRDIRAAVSYERVFGPRDDESFERAAATRVVLAASFPALDGALAAARVSRL